MTNGIEYVIVDSTVLPEVFLKVLTAKKLLLHGYAPNLTKAAEMADLSRSALYKYKDSVFPYRDIARDKVINIFAELRDYPGVLSELISRLYTHGANILTINQNIPTDGVAPVSIAIRINDITIPVQEMIENLKNENIISIKLVTK